MERYSSNISDHATAVWAS